MRAAPGRAGGALAYNPRLVFVLVPARFGVTAQCFDVHAATPCSPNRVFEGHTQDAGVKIGF